MGLHDFRRSAHFCTFLRHALQVFKCVMISHHSICCSPFFFVLFFILQSCAYLLCALQVFKYVMIFRHSSCRSILFCAVLRFSSVLQNVVIFQVCHDLSPQQLQGILFWPFLCCAFLRCAIQVFKCVMIFHHSSCRGRPASKRPGSCGRNRLTRCGREEEEEMVWQRKEVMGGGQYNAAPSLSVICVFLQLEVQERGGKENVLTWRQRDYHAGGRSRDTLLGVAGGVCFTKSLKSFIIWNYRVNEL